MEQGSLGTVALLAVRGEGEHVVNAKPVSTQYNRRGSILVRRSACSKFYIFTSLRGTFQEFHNTILNE
jgi:hypothetical protein